MLTKFIKCPTCRKRVTTVFDAAGEIVYVGPHVCRSIKVDIAWILAGGAGLAALLWGYAV